MLAYVVLGHCKTFDDVVYEIELLFKTATGIDVPAEISLAEIEKGPYHDMVVLKFKLHPAAKFNDREEWEMLDGNIDAIALLKPKT